MRRKTVFQVRNFRSAETSGSYGSLVKDQSTHDRSHFGVSEWEAGLCSSKALINSEMIGSEPIVVPDRLKDKVFAMQDLYPRMVLTESFFTSYK